MNTIQTATQETIEAMQKQPLTYHDGKQILQGQLFMPALQKSLLPAIVLFPAFEGIGDFIIEYATWLCEQGYVILVADVYGDNKSATTLEGCFELIKPFLNDRSLVRTRAQAAFAAISLLPNVDKNRIGALGFCFGGQCVLELARSGASLKAGISAHGMLSQSHLPTLSVQTHLMVLHGLADPQVPADHITNFSLEMTSAQCPDWQIILFSHAQHSFTDPRTGTFDPALEQSMGRAYHPVSAERTKEYVVTFFSEQLK